ncbi:hypothetical protein AU195_01680 [Mycobacterium sp. IS-1496]|uniref:polysaccharide pyruvyl transferase family protein n=1 Tax=Mycobacterium sp. IS-1496 TaxID=1772284 RepID=UPI0007416958|nr:polysaccharide pyruvyl transferase family protein [Mycobacterium sp. IS-1496]KUI24520.1 hypothetical protein AU195_01680 [Mycobacterium sp. IS-1496]
MSLVRSTGTGAAPAPPRGELIYLVAPAGNPNYGDDFIVRAWLSHLATHRPDADVVVDCHTPGQASVLLRRWHPRATFVDTVWRICFETMNLATDAAVTMAGDVVGDPGRMPRIASGIELLARADTVHLVGGGYVNTVWPHHLALLASATAAVALSGGRAVATGQGLLPVGDSSRLSLLRQLCAEFALFDVRDRPSHDAIGAASLSETGDDAWLGLGDDGVYDRTSAAADRPYVFCMQSDLMDDFAGGAGIDGLAETVRRLVERWDIRGDEVAFVEGIPGADRVVFDRVGHLLPGAQFVPFTDVWNRGLPARSGQIWVSTRFHHHLVAGAAGASGLALCGRSDYYPVKHRSLVDAGSPWHTTDDYDLPADPVGTGGFTAQTVATLRSRKRALATDLYPATPARRTHRTLRRLLGT